MGRHAALAVTSQRQHGAFSGDQAVRAGFSRSAIRGKVARGEWVRRIGDTFALAGLADTWQQRTVTAYLAVGQPCAVSHGAAAAWWDIEIDAPDRTTITVPWTRRPRLNEVEIVRTRRWGRLDVVRRGPIHVMSPSRTLLDLTPTLDGTTLEIALDAAHRKGVVEVRRLERFLAAAARNKVPGASELLGLVRLRDPERPVESAAETVLYEVLRRYGVPTPQPQLWVHTRNGLRRIDGAYSDRKVAVEVTGFAWRNGRAPFDDDKIRDSELADLGWQRRYITWTLLDEAPAEAAWTVARSIDLEPSRWRPARR